MTTITVEEVTQFRVQLKDYAEAISALDVIQECDGHLEDAMMLLIMRESGQEPDRSLDKLFQKSRQVICQEEFRNDLVGGLLGVAIEPVAISVGVPPSVATVFVIYAYKMGMNKFCDPSSPNV